MATMRQPLKTTKGWRTSAPPRSTTACCASDGTSGLAYAIQQSTDLGVKNPRTEVTGASYVNGTDMVSYSLPGGGPARIFLRFQVLSE